MKRNPEIDRIEAVRKKPEQGGGSAGAAALSFDWFPGAIDHWFLSFERGDWLGGQKQSGFLGWFFGNRARFLFGSHTGDFSRGMAFPARDALPAAAADYGFAGKNSSAIGANPALLSGMPQQGESGC